MNAKDNGGPAFPAPDLGEQDFFQKGAYPGMTLRDYFAAQAMNGSMASCAPDQDITPRLMAKWSYEMADAMLKARGA